MLRFIAFLVGITLFPGLLLFTRDAMNDDTSGFIVPWWALPLIAVGIWIVAAVLGGIVPFVVLGFIRGYRFGVLAAPIVAWFVPDWPVLYFAASMVALPIGLFTCTEQSVYAQAVRFGAGSRRRQALPPPMPVGPEPSPSS